MLPESSPVLPIIGGTLVCLPLTHCIFGAVIGTPTILVITLLHFGAVTVTPTTLVITPLHFGAVVNNGRTKETAECTSRYCCRVSLKF